ncbi:MAG TPA: SpoIIE family protein phosphatase [Candidatus Acidoferrales bacterium]|nr:SpoIIE family protein phosphatase [Candidatus Acidoferrales bacterium]
MSARPSPSLAHQGGFHPRRQDPYLRLGAITVFVRDQDRSLRFYLDQLGFSRVFDAPLQSADRTPAVTPPDGTAVLLLVAPQPGSEEYKLIGRPTQIVFLTEDVVAKFEEWSKRGVRFHHAPKAQTWGAISASFEDVDGNSFTLLGYEEISREVQQHRRAHAERVESEHRSSQELELARQVQARLFPQTQPALSTLEYAAVCIQARHVGGDYYDFLDLGREQLGLVIGDVSGKGVAAALLMANLQAHLRNQSATYSSRPFTPFVLEQPQRFLLSVNRLFYENTADSSFATLFFGEYNDKRRRLRYANCGHLPALLLRGDGKLERLDPTCTVLGLFKGWDCSAAEQHLSPGDTAVFYTDGVTESRNEAGEEFGESRLIEALRQHRELPPQNLLVSLVDHVRRFSPHEQRDDITMLVAKCR